MNKPAISPEIRELIEAVHYRPAVSVIMPFEPKMSVKAELTRQLKIATDKIEKELQQNYPDDLADVVIHKLKTIIRNLNFSTYKKSIAIFVSPVFEKVLYLDIPVEGKKRNTQIPGGSAEWKIMQGIYRQYQHLHQSKIKCTQPYSSIST
jgi:hypothetical protein